MTRNIARDLALEGIDVRFISYAHDLILLSSSLLDLQQKFSQTIKLYNRYGLKVNPTKTQFFVYSSHEHIYNRCIRTSSREVIRRNNSLR